ncbi:hypothetical protein [Fusobacterium sp. PH5-44]|uniref:hypothetical protein n=1 Tax=unclassified Fusobacterium TaxID=2648384 RepID=UPI003D25A9B6
MNDIIFKDENNKKFSLDGKINELYEKIKSYESFLKVKIDNDTEEIEKQYSDLIESMKKSVEQLKVKQLSPNKKLEQMQIKLDISELNTALQLKEIEKEDELENAKEAFQKKQETHNINIEKRKDEIIEFAKSCSQVIEKVIKSDESEFLKNKNLENWISTLDDNWKSIRERYVDMIDNERKSIKIFSLRLEELNTQKGSITNELEKAEKEKKFLEEKIQLEIIDGDASILIESENKKIEESHKKINKIERDIKKISIQRDAAKEKIDIIKTMIDEIIEEILITKFKDAGIIVPDFIKSIKYFGNNQI